MIFGAVVCEYIILTIIIINAVINFIRDRRALKSMINDKDNLKDMKKFDPMEWFIIHKWVEKPIESIDKKTKDT